LQEVITKVLPRMIVEDNLECSQQGSLAEAGTELLAWSSDPS